jgi:hypothetical protein
MTLVVILNIVLAIAVIGGIVRLLSWTIASSRADNLALTSRRWRPVPNPYTAAPTPRAAFAGAGRQLTLAPVIG